ncbi:NAD(P)H-binding protein [Gillisia sp. JM1]|uniref:NAD(P)H-binding protein n=1 Tax=Gillisia sp. JM1 TaxID=1283286 RepID=UPI000424AC08|nr:NAD(P)H-binding protein [Gillisia sp. JM1]
MESDKVFVAGASGVLGLEIVKLLSEKKIPIRVITSSEEGEKKLSPYPNGIWQADVSFQSAELKNINKDISFVISAMGKNLSFFSSSYNSFYETDFKANKNILEDAVKNKVKKFIYISIKGADISEDYTIPKALKLFEEELIASGLNYTFFRPVGLYSCLDDPAIMEKRKVIPIVGSGNARTNSIHQTDLAEVVVKHLHEEPNIIEVGGPLIHTRMEMAEMIKEKIGAQIIKVPKNVPEIGFAIPKFFSNNLGDKLDSFNFITTHDMIAENMGQLHLRNIWKA